MSRRSADSETTETPLFYKDYSERVTSLLYTLFFFCSLLINIDHGCIPAATLNLKTDLQLDNI